MKIKYEVEDGYVSGNRPHFVTVDDHDLAACETIEEQEELIDEAVQFDFEQNVYPCWDREQLSNAPEPNSLEEEQEDEDE